MQIPVQPASDAPLDILYRDDHYVLIDKPAGMLLHRSSISRDRVFVLQTLRDQLGTRVYPVHRLDRATAGVLAFGLSAEAAGRLASRFTDRSVSKRYLAVARGWVDADGSIDHPLADDDVGGTAQQAVTRYHCLGRIELPHAVDRYPTTRYSLVCVTPVTGRRQQIRKHFKHISHHLIGDTTHGNGRHNRFFRETYGIHRLLLLAWRLGFRHPYDGRELTVRSGLDDDWRSVLQLFASDAGRLSLC